MLIGWGVVREDVSKEKTLDWDLNHDQEPTLWCYRHWFFHLHKCITYSEQNSRVILDSFLSYSKASARQPCISTSTVSQADQPFPTLTATTLVQAAAISHLDFSNKLVTGSIHRLFSVSQLVSPWLLPTLRVKATVLTKAYSFTWSGLLSTPISCHSSALPHSPSCYPQIGQMCSCIRLFALVVSSFWKSPCAFVLCSILHSNSAYMFTRRPAPTL